MLGFGGTLTFNRRSTAVKKPIGFIGVATVLAKTTNLSFRVVNENGKGVANCVCLCDNTTTGKPFASSTDNDGYVALVADPTANILIRNNKLSYQLAYNRTAMGHSVTYVFKAQAIV